MIKCESCCLPCSISFLFEPVVVCLFVGVHYIIKRCTQVLHNCASVSNWPRSIYRFFFPALQRKTTRPHPPKPKQCTPLHSAVSRVAASQPQLHIRPLTQPRRPARARPSRLPARSRSPTSRHNGRCSVLPSRLLYISNSRRSSRKTGRHFLLLRRKPVR